MQLESISNISTVITVLMFCILVFFAFVVVRSGATGIVSGLRLVFEKFLRNFEK